ncbi:MAG: hypothetical protein ACUVQ7_10605, partial [bacterium]
PFFFYGYERARQARGKLQRIRSMLLLAVFLVLGYFAGFPQVFLFGVLSLLVYGFYLSIFENPSRRNSNLLDASKIFAISGVIAILIVSVQLVPFVELYRNSTGLKISLEEMTKVHVAPIFVLLKLIFPGLFGNPVEGTLWEHMTAAYFRPPLVHFALFCGVGTLMLAITSVTAFYRDPRIQVFAILLIGSTWIAVSPHLAAFLYKISPVFRASRIERISVVGCIAMSVLAGLCLDRLTELGGNPKLRRRAITAIVVVVCISLGVALFWQIMGREVLTRIAEGAKKTTISFWGKIPAYTRSSEVKKWIDGDIDAWLSYEKKQVGRGLAFVVANALILWLLIAHRTTSAKRCILKVILVMLVFLDIWLTARNYLVLQVPDCLFETRGIKVLSGLLSNQGQWRIRTTSYPGESIEVLPPNTNQIFQLQSLNGICTIIPKGYDEFQNAYMDFILPRSLRNRETPLAADQVLISNLGCARYVLLNRTEKVFLPNPIYKVVGSQEQTAQLIKILNLGGISKLAFHQPEAQMLNVRIHTPKVRFLDFEFGFNSDRSIPADTLFCVVLCKGANSELAFKRGFDLCNDKGRWHPIRIDLSNITGGTLELRFGWAARRDGRAAKVNVGWAGLDLVYDDCKVTETQSGDYVIEGNLGESVCLSIESNCKEVPLDVVDDSG